jgi:hypothetical protein
VGAVEPDLRPARDQARTWRQRWVDLSSRMMSRQRCSRASTPSSQLQMSNELIIGVQPSRRRHLWRPRRLSKACGGWGPWLNTPPRAQDLVAGIYSLETCTAKPSRWSWSGRYLAMRRSPIERALRDRGCYHAPHWPPDSSASG